MEEFLVLQCVFYRMLTNWCSSSYVLVGSADEVKELYGIMKKLERRKKASVENGFGITWLGCLVDALGEDWKKVSCRGEWNVVSKRGNTLRFTTETAWGPCNQVFDLICRKYPSIRYYFQSEEPGMVEYLTNDKEGKYFKDKYCVDVYTPEKEFKHKHFLDEQSLYKWLGDILGTIVTSADDIEKQNKRWYDTSSSAFCHIYEFRKI